MLSQWTLHPTAPGGLEDRPGDDDFVLVLPHGGYVLRVLAGEECSKFWQFW